MHKLHNFYTSIENGNFFYSPSSMQDNSIQKNTKRLQKCSKKITKNRQ